MSKIGAHVSAAVSLDLSLERAEHIGAECTQIFVSPPQRWLQTKHDDEEIANYLQKKRETKIEPNFIHGAYLINLATDNPEHLQKSIDWLKYALDIAQKIKATGVIFHVGSHKGSGLDSVLKQVANALNTILDDGDSRLRSNSKDPAVSSSSDLLPTGRGEPRSTPYLILENCAGSGGTIGCQFSELGAILKAANNSRIKICLDTQHAFAAGYDLREPLTIDDVLEDFDQQIGLDNLVAIHANDSKTDYKSNKDRHENIGEGLIGKAGFEYLLSHPKLQEVPFLLEVPGFADNGPDEENIDILKKLRDTDQPRQ